MVHPRSRFPAPPIRRLRHGIPHGLYQYNSHQADSRPRSQVCRPCLRTLSPGRRVGHPVSGTREASRPRSVRRRSNMRPVVARHCDDSQLVPAPADARPAGNSPESSSIGACAVGGEATGLRICGTLGFNTRTARLTRRTAARATNERKQVFARKVLQAAGCDIFKTIYGVARSARILGTSIDSQAIQAAGANKTGPKSNRRRRWNHMQTSHNRSPQAADDRPRHSTPPPEDEHTHHRENNMRLRKAPQSKVEQVVPGAAGGRAPRCTTGFEGSHIRRRESSRRLEQARSQSICTSYPCRRDFRQVRGIEAIPDRHSFHRSGSSRRFPDQVRRQGFVESRTGQSQ